MILRFAFVLGVCFSRSNFAELPLARLQSIFPPGGQAGATSSLRIEGKDLDDASALFFSDAGISARRQPSDPPDSFTVTILSNVPPGLYETRVIGRFGISNPRFFTVGTLPELTAENRNHSRADALKIPLNSTVNAVSSPAASDFYQFPARKGDRVLIECQGEPCDSKMRPVLVLYDAQGNEIERDRRGGLIDYRASDSAAYFLEVHDLTFSGGKDFNYRLTVSTRPHLDFIFPPARSPGTDRQFTVYGRNLPGGELCPELRIRGKVLEKLAIETRVPKLDELFPTTAWPQSISEIALDSFDYRLPAGGGPSFPRAVFVASASARPEQERNSDPAAPQQISPPCEIQGQFYPEGDLDCYEFHARKGDVFWIEIFSARLGEPTDPFVLVQKITRNKKGEVTASDLREMYDSDANIGGAVFRTSNRDPSWRFEASEEGDFRLSVRDLFNSQADPSRVYRLSIRRPTPDFRLIALIEPPPSFEQDKREARVWSTLLRRGDTALIKVLALRRDGFSGPIGLKIAGLPPEMRASESIIQEGQNSAWLTISSSEKAPEWHGAIQITGVSNDGKLARVARAATVAWDVDDYNNEAIHSRLARQLMMAGDAAPAPCRLEAPPAAFEILAGKKLSIPVKIIRSAEFNQPVKLRAYLDEQSKPLREWDADARANETSLELDSGAAKLAAGTHQLLVLAQTGGKMRRIRTEELAAFELEAKRADDEKKAAEKELSDIASALKMDKAQSEKKSGDISQARARELEKKRDDASARAKRIQERLKLHDVSGIFAAPLLRVIVTAPVTAAK